MESENKDNAFKNLATVLSLLLPIAQVFTTLLPDEAKKIILFSDQLLVISLFAGVMAYLLIVAFKSTVWFEFTFQKKQKVAYDNQQLKINSNVYEEKDLLKLIKNEEIEPAPTYINPRNIYYLLILIIAISIILFVALGLFFNGKDVIFMTFLQAIIYIILVGLISLTLGVFYINDLNNSKREDIQNGSWDRLEALLYARRAIPGMPVMDFIAEFPAQVSNQQRIRTIIRVESDYYAVDTDLDIKKVYEINIYNPSDRSIRPFDKGVK